MGKNKLFVRETYNDYFDRLKQMAETVEELRKVAKEVDKPLVQKEIQEVISSLETELKGYAENLRTTGTEIFKHVA